MNDLVKLSVTIGSIDSEEDAWAANLNINEALLELTHRTPGPVHINLVTNFSMSFNQDALPDEKKISRYGYRSEFPPMPEGRITVFVGNHVPFNEIQTEALDDFCLRHNAVVFCDQTSNYRGRYRVLPNLLTDQDFLHSPLCQVDLLIHIGSISGSYMGVTPKQVWRVNADGKLLDPFKKLSAVFEIDELTFFQKYAEKTAENEQGDSFLNEISGKIQALRDKIPELPFSNAWCAQQSSPRLPEGSALHLGILNTLRVWNYFETPSSVTCWSNTGGFGIDGGTSSLLGASLLNPQKLYFGISGDLAFFYDMNVMGNRHVSSNIRIMVINNGKGVEFKNYSHAAAALGESADPFVAASGHFAQQSRQLLKHFSEDLGFKYLSASTKEEFLASASLFFDPKPLDSPVLFEVFTDEAMESQALRDLRTIERSNTAYAKSKTKDVVKEILGEKGVQAAKRLIGK
jgi:2-succinyl-6-hydroxy-2,4-cyclohexadiene-1-carboxylate synthase